MPNDCPECGSAETETIELADQDDLLGIICDECNTIS